MFSWTTRGARDSLVQHGPAVDTQEALPEFRPRNPQDGAGHLLSAEQVHDRQQAASRQQLQQLYTSPEFAAWRRRKLVHDIKYHWIPRAFIGLAILLLASGASTILVNAM